MLFDDRFYSMRGIYVPDTEGFGRYISMIGIKTPQPPYGDDVLYLDRNDTTYTNYAEANPIGGLILSYVQGKLIAYSVADETTKELTLAGDYTNRLFDQYAAENVRMSTTSPVSYYNYNTNTTTNFGSDTYIGETLGYVLTRKYYSSTERLGAFDIETGVSQVAALPDPLVTSFYGTTGNVTPYGFYSSDSTQASLFQGTWYLSGSSYLYDPRTNSWALANILSMTSSIVPTTLYVTKTMFEGDVVLLIKETSGGSYMYSAVFDGVDTFVENSQYLNKTKLATINGTNYYYDTATNGVYVYSNKSFRLVFTDASSATPSGTQEVYMQLSPTRFVLRTQNPNNRNTSCSLYIFDLNNNLYRKIADVGYAIYGKTNNKIFYMDTAGSLPLYATRSVIDLTSNIPTVTSITNSSPYYYMYGPVVGYGDVIIGRGLSNSGNLESPYAFYKFNSNRTKTKLFVLNQNPIGDPKNNVNPRYSANANGDFGLVNSTDYILTNDVYLTSYVLNNVLYISFCSYVYGETQEQLLYGKNRTIYCPYDQMIAYDMTDDLWGFVRDKKGGFALNNHTFISKSGETIYKIGDSNVATSLSGIDNFSSEYIGNGDTIIPISSL